MKPLTIEQLKSLEVGDWVWIVGKEISSVGKYHKIIDGSFYAPRSIFLRTDSGRFAYAWDFPDYGTKWLAYKNKEQAESKITNGSILRMLSNAELADFLCSEDFQRLKMSYSSSVLGINDWLNAELTEEQAERRLAELRGEK